MRPALSIVVPLRDEVRNVPLLVEALQRAFPDREDWELILVDDGSEDGTAALIESLAAEHAAVRGVLLARGYGQTAALQVGFDHARGRVVVSMDGDLQNDPRDIPRLLEVLSEGHDLVAGYRTGRKDGLLTRRLPSTLANRLIARVTGVPIRDNGCTLKAYRRELLDCLVLYSEQHRFIPALAASYGAGIAQVPVRHHPRRFGRSKYGLSRTLAVLGDLLTVKVVTGLSRRPHAVFALAGGVGLGASVTFLAMWAVAVLTFRPVKAAALVFPGGALLCASAAFFLLMLGLVAEIALAALSRSGPGPVLVHEDS